MAYCLTASSHYLNEYWLTINGVLWNSTVVNLSWNYQDINSWNGLKNTILKLLPHPSGAKELIRYIVVNAHLLVPYILGAELGPCVLYYLMVLGHQQAQRSRLGSIYFQPNYRYKWYGMPLYRSINIVLNLLVKRPIYRTYNDVSRCMFLVDVCSQRTPGPTNFVDDMDMWFDWLKAIIDKIIKWYTCI